MIRSLNGKTPIIAKSAFISETAYIVGDVEIGENTSVWPGAVIRGDFGKITIGRNTAIEDNVVVHCGSPTFPNGDVDIGNDVIIGHGAVLNCRRVGNNILIGINAAILHDAEIGDNSIIAAGCVVGNGMKVPEQSMVAGVPGKIVGRPSGKQLYWIQGGSEVYRKLAEEYIASGLNN